MRRGDARGAGGGPADTGGDVEVVASGNALCVVSGWLGMTEEEALAEAGPAAASTAPVPARRQQFLGLGAKYLPHHKAVETATALDNKLRRRLERGLAARQEAEEEEALAHRGGKRPRQAGPEPGRDKLGRGGLLSSQRAGGGGGGKRAAQEADEEDEDDEEEEVERKGAAPVKTRTHGAVHGGLSGGAAHAAAANRPTGPGAAAGAGDGGAERHAVAAAGMVARSGAPAAPVSSKAAREALLLAPVGNSNSKKKKKKQKLRS
ncbi:hypothetical protein HYH02_014788 [Chlamydomonas schloesseri]|uniref:Uncharacterized protein n=1 Tax=Chlamydomonas schloesseri TaxID=2026947 RepID=A0A835SG95_9CHLO|nr:hypothetical protein HYH02_014788 [Chlamydomonas schloesseri]|eukprot:KAG2426429.1 hypothetical protein HYH02_014788 [Chlamydomonas schloesseri]